jgi:acyl-CoA thioesterase FadM
MTLSAHHVAHIQLRYHDADANGLAHYTTVLHACDAASLAWLASQNVEPFVLPIHHIEVRYGNPLNVLSHPLVSVHSTYSVEPLHGGRISVQSQHDIVPLDDGPPFAVVAINYAANRDQISTIRALVETAAAAE